MAGARQQLLTLAATAKRSGYHQIEYESRLALGELELKANPKLGRFLLNELAESAHGQGLQLISRKASYLATGRNVFAAVAR